MKGLTMIDITVKTFRDKPSAEASLLIDKSTAKVKVILALTRGDVVLWEVHPDENHDDLVTDAWVYAISKPR
jgi:hypothetical protein